MRTVWLIPVLAVLLIGAGCALTQSQSEKEVQGEVPELPAVANPSLTPVKTLNVEPTPSLNPPVNPPVNPLINPPINPPPSPRVITMKVGDFFFDPKAISVKPGESITVMFTGSSGHHNFTIDELNIHEPISEGGSVTITVPSTPGRYAYYCSIGAHRALGMEGTLVVE